MSRSSARERPHGRGQVEPVVALVAVVVLAAGLSTYAVATETVRPRPPDRDLATPVLRRAVDGILSGGVAAPARLRTLSPSEIAPSGFSVNVTLVAAGRQWHRGPSPPADADAATRTVPVAVARGRARPGRLRVVVWT